MQPTLINGFYLATNSRIGPWHVSGGTPSAEQINNANAIKSFLVDGEGWSLDNLLMDHAATTVFQPDNYPAFMKWVYSRIASIASLFKEMSTRYQTTLTNKPVPRHTPYNKQKMYMLGQDRYQIDSRVLADTFHDNYLKYADVETLNFWQGIETPDKIIVKPTYTNTSGVVTTPTNAITKTGVFALLFDEDAMGWSMIHQKVIPTPVNARGEYRNMWYHMRLRCFSDNTEKGVVFLLD